MEILYRVHFILTDGNHGLKYNFSCQINMRAMEIFIILYFFVAENIISHTLQTLQSFSPLMVNFQHKTCVSSDVYDGTWCISCQMPCSLNFVRLGQG